jgi:hypothetical protein
MTTNAAPSVESGSAPAPVASSVKPKRKKKKKEDLSKFIRADVQQYYQKKGTIQKPVEDAQIGISVPVPSPVIPVSSESVKSPQMSSKPGETTLPSAVTPVVEDKPMRDEAKPANGIYSNDVDGSINIHGQPEDVEMVDLAAQVILPFPVCPSSNIVGFFETDSSRPLIPQLLR